MFMQTRGFSWTLLTRHESAPKHTVPLLVVLGHNTVPDTEKATVFCEVCWYTHKEPNDFEVSAETPLVQVVLDSLQKKIHIVIRLLQMD